MHGMHAGPSIETGPADDTPTPLAPDASSNTAAPAHMHSMHTQALLLPLPAALLFLAA